LLADCIKLAEETLQAEGYKKQKDDRLRTHMISMKSSPRHDRTGHTTSGTSQVNLSNSNHIESPPQTPDSTSDQEFVDFLDDLDYPETFDDLEEWLDDINLFMEGLCNPHMINEL